MSQRERFAALVRSTTVPLGEGCLVIAAHLGHPEPVDEGLLALSRLADEVVAARPEPDLTAVGRHLFETLGFSGNHRSYYDVANSMLPEVLRRRTGIPITLAVVVIEVAERLGLSATGVGMPGHFLVGDGAAPHRWLDGFDGGRWLDAAGAEERFRSIHGVGATFDPAFLLPTPRPQILGRVLANLAGTYRALGDPVALRRTLELRCDIPGVGTAPRAQVELAEAHVAVGCIADAIGVLEALVPRVDPRRREMLEARITQLRAGLN